MYTTKITHFCRSTPIYTSIGNTDKSTKDANCPKITLTRITAFGSIGACALSWQTMAEGNAHIRNGKCALLYFAPFVIGILETTQQSSCEQCRLPPITHCFLQDQI